MTVREPRLPGSEPPENVYLSRCISFGFWRVCEGDVVVLVDVRGRTFSGVVRGFYSGFIALSPDCTEAKPNRFTKIQYVMEVNLVGSCTEEATGVDTAGRQG